MKTAIALLVMMVGAVGQGQKFSVPIVIDSWSSYTNTEGKQLTSACAVGSHLEWIATLRKKPQDTMWTARCYKNGYHGKQPVGIEEFPGPVWKVTPRDAPKPILGDETDGYQVKKPQSPWGSGSLINTSVTPMQWASHPNRGVEISHVDGDYQMHDDSTVSVNSATGRIDRLSDEEYKELQSTPLKDVEAEKVKLARAHGVRVAAELIHVGTHTCLGATQGAMPGEVTSNFSWIPTCDVDQYSTLDKWLIVGQWLAVGTGFVAGRE